jgi:hypothetical protein
LVLRISLRQDIPALDCRNFVALLVLDTLAPGNGTGAKMASPS